MEKKQLPACPVETTLSLIGDKWKVLILRDLMDGTKRFGELKKSIGSVSQKVLTVTQPLPCNALLVKILLINQPKAPVSLQIAITGIHNIKPKTAILPKGYRKSLIS